MIDEIIKGPIDPLGLATRIHDGNECPELRWVDVRAMASVIVEMNKALKTCAEDWSSGECTPMMAGQIVFAKLKRRAEIAGAAIDIKVEVK